MQNGIRVGLGDNWEDIYDGWNKRNEIKMKDLRIAFLAKYPQI